MYKILIVIIKYNHSSQIDHRVPLPPPSHYSKMFIDANIAIFLILSFFTGFWVFHTVLSIFFPYICLFISLNVSPYSLWMMLEFWYLSHPLFYAETGVILSALMFLWVTNFTNNYNSEWIKKMSLYCILFYAGLSVLVSLNIIR